MDPGKQTAEGAEQANERERPNSSKSRLGPFSLQPDEKAKSQ